MTCSVYILDDDPQYTQLLRGICRTCQLDAVTFTTATQFLKDIPREGILVLDLKMPSCDGIDVIRELAACHSTLKLILVSGYDSGVLNSAKTLAEACDLPVVAVFNKPIQVNSFREALNKALQVDSKVTQFPATKTTVSVEELSKAIDNNELFLQYQPQYNLKLDAIVGFEALVRWQHSEFGVLYPDSFIELAEKHQLISGITRRVLIMAFEQLSIWLQSGENWHVSVNISANDLAQINLPEYLCELQKKYNVPSSNMMLELTESAATGSMINALDILNRLRLRGFSLSVDDFGTSYSSLSKLHDAPFNELKIDRKFITDLKTDDKSLAIAKTCTTLAKMLNMQVVAEGVEDQETMEILRGLDCDLIQGYYISKPLSSVDVEKSIKRAS